MTTLDRVLRLKVHPVAAFAVAFAIVGLFVLPFTRDSAQASYLKPATPFTKTAQLAAHQDEENLLQEKKTEMLAAKILEGLAPKFDKWSQNAEKLSQNAEVELKRNLAADSLNNELAKETEAVQKLREEVKSLSKYVKEVERSISIIDAAANTPHVLKHKIDY